MVIFGINTIQNKTLADLDGEYCCIPWNPSYLNQMSLIAQFLPGFDEEMLFKGLTPPSDFVGLITFLATNVLYDGFPTFLPCKMIMQNPNLEAVPPSGLLKQFRTIADNWNTITNKEYWKLIGKIVGNIDITSWSGDINIKTKGSLGNAGNINIRAQNKYGALPGYKTGNVIITADAPQRIYTDPRDLFLDTHLIGKLQNNFVFFSSSIPGGNPLSPPPPQIVPFRPVQMVINALGVPASLGFASPNSNGGGCIGCIFDVVAQVAADLMLFNICPWTVGKKAFEDAEIKDLLHKFNTSKASFMNPDDVPPGSVSIMKKTSNGFGHAVDKFGMDELFSSTDYSMGGILLNGTGSYELHVTKNAVMQSDLNNWKFGPSAALKTGWIFPSESVNPLDAILGESPFPLIPGRIGEPSIETFDRALYNEYDGYTFGGYSATFKKIAEGVYMLPLFKAGWFGIDESKWKLDVPNLMSELNGVKLMLSSVGFNIKNNSYEIDPLKYTLTLKDPNKYIGVTTLPASQNGRIKMFAAGPRAAANNTDDTFVNEIKFELGPSDFKYKYYSKIQSVKLKTQLPNTAAAMSLAVPIASVLSKLIPGIGDAAMQAAKALPNMPVPDQAILKTSQDYLFDIFNETKYKGFMFHSSQVSGGLLYWPSGKPLAYGIGKVAMPDFVGIADGLISVGSLLDPIGTLTKTILQDIPGALNTAEANATVGLALPKPLGEALGISDIISAETGLFPGRTVKTTVNFLDSESDRKGAWAQIKSTIPIPPDIKWSIKGEAYALKCGLRGEFAIPPMNGNITVDIIDEMFAMKFQGPLVPGWQLFIGGKQIFNVPGGGGGILGSGIIKAITDVFF